MAERITHDLSGVWDCRLDPGDRGLLECWQTSELRQGEWTAFQLPGTTGTNQLGAPCVMPPSAVDETHMQSLRQRYTYTGALWLQRWVDMPADLPDGARIELYLERVLVTSMVWLDGHYVGEDASLATAHRHDLTDGVRPGARQLLTVRIDNRDCMHLDVWGSSYTNETQSIWNGVVGEISLRVYAGTIDNVQVFPDITASCARISYDVTLPAPDGLSDGLPDPVFDGSSDSSSDKQRTVPVTIRTADGVVVGQADAEAQPGHHTVTVALADFTPWNEFTPMLYEVQIGDADPVRFGMRELAADASGLRLNGTGLFLRGNVECCVFPRTGFPPCDEASWERMYTKLKKLGFNHVRFHSWCPPEAAFTVADRMGLYLQVEGPIWLDAWIGDRVGTHPEHYRFIQSELQRIMRDYGNHPSLCILSCGNELSGDFTFLEDVLRTLREQDRRCLYTLTSNTVGFERTPTAQDDCFVGVTYGDHPVRGQYDLDAMVGSTALSYDAAVEASELPLISHEVGQYAVFPDVAEIDSYDGTLEPVNLETVRDDLVRKDLLPMAGEFVRASAHLAQAMYRADVETMLRTRGLGGVQVLSLQDFPGQKTATVGLLNGFWQPKSDEPIDLHWGPVTPLAVTDRLRYEVGDCLHAEVKVSNFGAGTLPAGRWQWSLTPVQGDGSPVAGAAPVAAGSFEAPSVPCGELSDVIGVIDADLGYCTDMRLSLRVCDESGMYANSWDIWTYRRRDGMTFRDRLNGDVAVAAWFDDDIRTALAEGRRAVILADPNAMRTMPAGGEFFPVFWSPMHFPSVCPCGMWCEAEHPAFGSFPTGRYGDLNWKDALEHSFSMDISALPRTFQPLTTVVPNFATIAWRTNLFECRVGSGRLLVTSIDLDADTPSVRALARSLAAYVNGAAFDPQQQLSADQAAALFIDPQGEEARSRGHLTVESLRVPRTIVE